MNLTGRGCCTFFRSNWTSARCQRTRGQVTGGLLFEGSVRRNGLRVGGRSRIGRCRAPAWPDGAAERQDRCLRGRAVDGEDVAGQAPPAAGVQNDGPSTRALASPRLPAQHAPADRTARLQRDRLRDIVSRRGRPGLPRHSPQRAVPHDLGSAERALLHAERHALPEDADAGGSVARATVLRSRPGDRGRLLRLLPRPEGCAPNAIELHPILAYTCLKGGTAPPLRPLRPGGRCAASYPTV